MAHSYKLPGGQVIPTESESQVRDGIRLAAKAHHDVGDGGGWDDPGLRAHLTARAKAHGIPHIIPPDWKREDTSAKAMLAKASHMAAEAARFSDPATARMYLDAASELRKQAAAAPDAPVTADPSDFPALDMLTTESAVARSVAKGVVAVIAGGRLAELERDLARLRGDLAAGRRQLAGGLGGPVMRQRSTRQGELLAKAARYDHTAGDMTLDRALRQGYEELAAQARREASMA